MKKIVLTTFLMLAAIGSYAQMEGIRMINHAIDFLGRPYVAHTLEVNAPDEQLIINCDEVDCTTFVEYVLAMALTPIMENGDISETAFADNLMKIRYRDGKVDGYPSRLHYIADWVNNGVKHGLIEDVAAAHSPFVQKVDLSFMSSHPDLYKQLAQSPENLARMKEIEASLNGQEFHYIPKEELPHEGRSWIKSGDIIALTTSIPGLDVSHMGLAFYADGKLTLLHASSAEKKVVINRISLRQYLHNSERLTGIRVLRIKQ